MKENKRTWGRAVMVLGTVAFGLCAGGSAQESLGASRGSGSNGEAPARVHARFRAELPRVVYASRPILPTAPVNGGAQ